MWLKKLQLAIIERDPKRIADLVDNMPDFDSLDSMKRASILIKEGIKVVEEFKEETALALKKIQKHRDFLNSTHNEKKQRRFDITS